MRTVANPTAVSVGALTRDRVRNPLGEDLGEIKDLVVEVETGRVLYAVLSFGGILGMGDKWFAIPWQALTYRAEDEHFILDVEKERLEQAPGFDKHNWPNMADRQWQRDVHAHFRIEPYWEELAPTR